MSAQKSCNPQENYIEEVLNAFSLCSRCQQNHQKRIYLYINLDSGKVEITHYEKQASNLEKIHQFTQKFLNENHLSDEQLLRFYQSVVELNKEKSSWVSRFFSHLRGKESLSKKIEEIFIEVHQKSRHKECCEREACQRWMKENYPYFSDEEIEAHYAHFMTLCSFISEKKYLPSHDEVKFLLDMLDRNIPVDKGWKILKIFEIYPMVPPSLSLVRLLSSMNNKGLEDVLHFQEEFGSRWKTAKISSILNLIHERSDLDGNDDEFQLLTLEIQLLLEGKLEECSSDECRRVAKIVFYCPLLEKAIGRIKQLPFVTQNKLIELSFRQNQSISAEEVNKIRLAFDNFVQGIPLSEAMYRADLKETPFL